ncbi:hypothetical protein DFJ74DRAFT_710357 [Hyaloraphidium curvatum]|nr:hypothetical protein DFJ74DRAFT_710357 [Hyaloraphidium curvatum]
MSIARALSNRTLLSLGAARGVVASRGYADGLPSINKVHLTAEVYADPQIRKFQSKDGTDRTVSNLFVSNNEERMTKDGKPYVHRTFFKVRSFNPKINELIDQQVSKGTYVMIEGKIVRDSWENKEGAKVYETSIEIPEKGNLQIISQPQGNAR